MKKGILYLLTFVALLFVPLWFWLEGPGFDMLQKGTGGIFLRIEAVVTAFLMALVFNGFKIGKPWMKKVEHGPVIFSLFWGVFIFLLIVLSFAANTIIKEA